MIRKTFILILTLLTLSCQKKTFTIGMITSETGKYAPLLKSCRNGAILAVEDIKRIHGYDIRIIVENNQSIKEENRTSLKKLQDQGIDIIITSITSGDFSYLQKYSNNQELLLISPTISSTNFDKLDDNLIRFTPSTALFAEYLAMLFMEKELDDLVIISDSNNVSYSTALTETFISTLTRTGYRFDFHNIPFNSTDDPSFLEIKKKISPIDKDSILIIASPLDTAILSQQLFNENAIFLYAPWSISQELIDNGGKAVDGALFYARSDLVSQSEQLQDFNKRYYDRFGMKPSYQSITNYDTVWALYKVLKESSRHDPISLKNQFIETSIFEGIHYQYTIDRYGDCKSELLRLTIKDGIIVPVSTSDPNESSSGNSEN